MTTSFSTSVKSALAIGLMTVLGLAASTALAGGPPYDAGYKALGMKERAAHSTARYTVVCPPQYRSYSYAPTASRPAPIAQQHGVRRYSYQASPAPVYRYSAPMRSMGRSYSGYGGDYPSKAVMTYR